MMLRLSAFPTEILATKKLSVISAYGKTRKGIAAWQGLGKKSSLFLLLLLLLLLPTATAEGLRCQRAVWIHESDANIDADAATLPMQQDVDTVETTVVSEVQLTQLLCSVLFLKEVKIGDKKMDIYLADASPVNKTHDRYGRNLACNTNHSNIVTWLNNMTKFIQKRYRNAFNTSLFELVKNNPDKCTEYICDFDDCNSIGASFGECWNQAEVKDPSVQEIQDLFSKGRPYPSRDYLYMDEPDLTADERKKLTSKCESKDYEVKLTDANWFECWGPDDGSPLGSDFVPFIPPKK